MENVQFEQLTADWVMGKLSLQVEHDDTDGCETAVTIAIEGVRLLSLHVCEHCGKQGTLS